VSAVLGTELHGVFLLILALAGITSGVLMIVLGRSVSTAPNVNLTCWSDLQADDPRRARTRSDRRRDWLLGAAIWAAGWPLGLGAALFLPLPGLVRLGLFLALTWGAVAVGSRWMRNRTGGTAWPTR